MSGDVNKKPTDQSKQNSKNKQNDSVLSCTLNVKQFLSNTADGNIFNPSIIFNPKIKLFLDENQFSETKLFFDMQEKVDLNPKKPINDLVLDTKYDFDVKSLLSVLTMELYDYPTYKLTQHVFNPKEFDIGIFISAIKLNLGYFIPDKEYNLILQFTGNLNPIIYEFGDILTNINPNEVSCSCCKTCNLFNYLKTSKNFDYFSSTVSEDLLVTSVTGESVAEKDQGEAECCCVKYADIEIGKRCLKCVVPCCSHKFNVESKFTWTNEIILMSTMLRPVKQKSSLSLIDNSLQLLTAFDAINERINSAFKNQLGINFVTFVQIVLISILLFPYNVLPFLFFYSGVSFLVLSSKHAINDALGSFKANCVKCIDPDSKMFQTRYSDIYKPSNCIKCLHLKRYSETNTIKNILVLSKITIGNTLATKFNPLILFLLSLFDYVKVLIYASQNNGKFLGLLCVIFSFILFKSEFINNIFYFLSLLSIPLTLVKQFKPIYERLGVFNHVFKYIVFTYKRHEFNNSLGSSSHATPVRAMGPDLILEPKAEVHPEERSTNMEVELKSTSKDGLGGTWESLPLGS